MWGQQKTETVEAGKGVICIKTAEQKKIHGDPEYRLSILFRSAKVLTHEIGHLLGIKHCTYYECLMSGCNHRTCFMANQKVKKFATSALRLTHLFPTVEEFDKRPLSLCPIDLRKLRRVMKFDCVKRYGEMSKLYNEFGWDDNTTWCDSRIVFLKREK